MKRCPTCNCEKNESAFHKNASKSDGLHNQCKQCRRSFYDENSKRILKYNRSWNDENRDRIAYHNEKRKLSIKGRAEMLWHGARLRAVEKNINFTLSLARIEVCLMLGRCERTSIEFDFTPTENSKNNPFAPSIDKINPFGDYSDANIKVVVWAYNVGKAQMSHDSFVAFCRKVVEFNK